MDLPADEAPADGHLFTLVHHSGPWLAVHHSILVRSPRLAPALNPTTHTLQSGPLSLLHSLLVCGCTPMFDCVLGVVCDLLFHFGDFLWVSSVFILPPDVPEHTCLAFPNCPALLLVSLHQVLPSSVCLSCFWFVCISALFSVSLSPGSCSFSNCSLIYQLLGSVVYLFTTEFDADQYFEITLSWSDTLNKTELNCLSPVLAWVLCLSLFCVSVVAQLEQGRCHSTLSLHFFPMTEASTHVTTVCACSVGVHVNTNKLTNASYVWLCTGMWMCICACLCK